MSVIASILEKNQIIRDLSSPSHDANKAYYFDNGLFERLYVITNHRYFFFEFEYGHLRGVDSGEVIPKLMDTLCDEFIHAAFVEVREI